MTQLAVTNGLMGTLMLAHAVDLLTLLTRFAAMGFRVLVVTFRNPLAMALFHGFLSGDNARFDSGIGNGPEDLCPLQDIFRRAVPSMRAHMIY